MKVLVTGATGFLGSHLTETLVKQGEEVKALVRDKSKAKWLKELGVELSYGDLRECDSLISATKGVELIYHCAGMVKDWGKKELFYEANVQGTKNLLETAMKSGCKVVHTSSLSALGLSKSLQPIDETFPYAERKVNLYTETKRKAEKLAFEYSQEKGVPVIIVRPGLIWGPRDTTILPRIILLIKKRLMFLVNGGVNRLALSYCSNVVDGLILAGKSGIPGRIYHITDGERVSAREYFCALANLFHLPPPRIPVPFSLFFVFASLMEKQARLRRREEPPLITCYGLYLLTSDLEIDLSRARMELGYQPKIGFKEGIRRMEEWIKGENAWREH